MVNFGRKTAILMLSLILFVTLLTSTVLATNASDVASRFSDGQEKIICIAHRGDWHSFPERQSTPPQNMTQYP